MPREEFVDLVFKACPERVRNILWDISRPLILKSRVIAKLQHSVQKCPSYAVENVFVPAAFHHILPAGLRNEVGLDKKLQVVSLVYIRI
jgi:hypothetical protein